MPTAEELLASELCDDILTVDLDTRVITIPKHVTNIGVESDDDVRLLHFQLPRHYCEVDLSEFAIRINYLNAESQGDVYEAINVVVGEDMITFDWLVGRYAVTYVGDVVFNVCLKDIDSDGVVKREFNTTTATLPVLPGLEPGEAIVQEYIDILEQWRASLFGTGDTVEQSIKDTGEEVKKDIENSVDKFIADNIDILKGETGATFTPSVSSDGVISWTNDRELENPTSVNIKGPKGDTGTGFKVLGYFDTVEELEATITNPEVGDAYGILSGEPGVFDSTDDGQGNVTLNLSGTANYDIHIYDANKGWVNNGKLQGAKGDTGATFIPSVSTNGVLSWSNDGGLENPQAVNLRGPAGNGVPDCTEADNGKFLKVVDGIPTWTTILKAEEVGF